MMKITFKLFATLTDYLPLPARRANLVGAGRYSFGQPADRVAAGAAAPPGPNPQLLVRFAFAFAFAFAGVDERQRYVFMKRFDLYMQRGGG